MLGAVGAVAAAHIVSRTEVLASPAYALRVSRTNRNLGRHVTPPSATEDGQRLMRAGRSCLDLHQAVTQTGLDRHLIWQMRQPED